jgi:hypothetical protein
VVADKEAVPLGSIRQLQEPMELEVEAEAQAELFLRWVRELVGLAS